ncbi:Ankyrin repeat and SAM domain-containing protein 3 [Colletotrichum sp. SAR 10_70]|nr:Ankyrin repeat and SAM domain-containing protein 3 [Colletotrichum sp. SAR 10_71]KAI8190518.1 Ankyrin repeat and SAM domain-containing protein 3 [Colletotrichum sp. SAR 10_70]
MFPNPYCSLIAALCLSGGVAADGWDDFTNNLASDLAPIISLFGEQATKQYLSESITWLDYFIFAMAPIGILTALVSAIRVCGSPSLKAFIGRAKEAAGNVEAELLSSTSRNVCELYNGGGIERIIGRPKILEVVLDRNVADEEFTREGGSAGIYTFSDYH